MTTSITMFGREQLLRAYLTPDIFVPPTGLEVALTLTIAPRNASADQLNEPTAPEYARQPYPMDGAHWAPTGFGELYNTTLVTFPQVANLWGMLAGWALVETGSGQCIETGSIMSPYAPTQGMIPKMEPGTITIGIYD